MNTKVIPTAAVIVLGVGSVNSIAKNKKLPSTRFLIGTGVVFMVLAILAEADEQVANALAIAVAVTVVLGEGDGVFSYVNRHGEADTKAPSRTPKNVPGDHNVKQGSTHPLDETNIYHLPTLTPIPNIG
jgi:hypothetical protein